MFFMELGERANPVVGKKFVFIQQVAEQTQESVARGDRQQAMAA